MLAPIALLCANPGATAMHIATSPTTRVQAERVETLLDSPSARVSLLKNASQSVSLFTIEAKGGSAPIDASTIDSVFEITETVIADGTRFKTMWNLQNVPVPPPFVVYKCMRWALTHKRELDRLNVCMAVVLPSNRSVILSVVDSVLRAFGPRCPVRVTSRLDDATAFLDNLG